MRTLTAIGTLVFVGSVHSGEPVPWPVAEGGNDHAYQAVHVSAGVSWSAARDMAEALGGYLATITSDEENLWVFDLIDESPEFWATVGEGTRGPWIGGLKVDGAWSWVTGEDFVYESWEIGEPTGDGDRIHYYGAGQGNCTSNWNDLPGGGGAVRGFIVEFDPLPPSIASQPACGTFVDSGSGPLALSVAATGTGPLEYQWFLNGEAIADGGAFGGTETSTILISPSTQVEGVYEVVVSNSAGSITSAPSVLAVRNPIPADLDEDGEVNFIDLLQLLSFWTP